jgi:hypothetical protein
MVYFVQAPTALISEVTNRQPHVESPDHPAQRVCGPSHGEPTWRDETTDIHRTVSYGTEYMVNHLHNHSCGDSHSHFGSLHIRQPYNHNQFKRSSPMRGVNPLSSPVQGLPAACVRSIVGHRWREWIIIPGLPRWNEPVLRNAASPGIELSFNLLGIILGTSKQPNQHVSMTCSPVCITLHRAFMALGVADHDITIQLRLLTREDTPEVRYSTYFKYLKGGWGFYFIVSRRSQM